ncbi:hypothetical protein LCL97_03130 [Seohaeicola saemankumensis]|nr:hypothetical protein [Seohaeicola saemankumensis]MCA0869808.1 hypothetical protein [Seohaeicola saemankumensis]
MVTEFLSRGWARFPFDPGVAEWARHALADARRAVADPALAQWHVCQGTWFVGVDALDNDRAGRVRGSSQLAGPAIEFLTGLYGTMPDLHRGQVSVVYPGYPKPRDGEGPGAFRYRQRRDAAHLDGLKPEGAARRRKIRECHAFILGLPLCEAPPGAAPLVVWDGSHEILRAALRRALAGHPERDWPKVDVTDVYQSARSEIFARCRRMELSARPGEAYVLHRLALHGVAPWSAVQAGGADGRMIAYFRPVLTGGIKAWLDLP